MLNRLAEMTLEANNPLSEISANRMASTNQQLEATRNSDDISDTEDITLAKLIRERDEWKGHANDAEAVLFELYTAVAEDSPAPPPPEDLKYAAMNHRLENAQREIKRLKGSDRAKGKYERCSLRLKIAWNVWCDKTSTHEERDTGTEDTLKEALALAQERIRALQSTGDGLVQTIDDQEMASKYKWQSSIFKPVTFPAWLSFRKELEDESFKEAARNWQDLLEE